MKKIKSAHIVAVIFGIIIIGGMLGFFNLNSFIKPVAATILSWKSDKSVAKNISAIEDNIEGLINENVGFRTSYIQVNGLAQKLMGKRVVEDVDPESSVIKLNNGYISFLAKEMSDDTLQDRADKISELNKFLSEKDIDFLYVQAPYKIAGTDQQLPYGLKDYAVSNAQKLCSILDKDVAVLNLIDVIGEQNKDWYSLFFKTDHHWTNEAGFWAYTEIAKYIEAEYDFNIEHSHLDTESYTKKTYEKIFLGSLGKRTGSTYAGLDDISFLIPNFETSFEYSCPINNTYRSGKFEDTLLFEGNITGNYFDDFCYSASLGGDFGYMKITNELNPNEKKIIVIKDSFANPVLTHLALSVSELEIIDLRYFESEMNMSVTNYISQSNPDLVIMLYNPNALKDNMFFNY